MEPPPFIFSLALTLLFSSVAAVYHYKLFLKRDLAIAISLFSLLVYCIVYFVSFEDNIGLGIGLLGILSLIRLRTAVNSLIDIAFVFYAITLGLLNASLAEQPQIMVSLNLFLTIMVCFLASPILFNRKRMSTQIVFDHLEFADLKNHRLLKERVHKVLKVDPIDIQVLEVDHIKDTVTLKVIYELH